MLVTLNPIPPSLSKKKKKEYLQDQRPLVHVLETWGLGLTSSILAGPGRDES